MLNANDNEETDKQADRQPAGWIDGPGPGRFIMNEPVANEKFERELKRAKHAPHHAEAVRLMVMMVVVGSSTERLIYA